MILSTETAKIGTWFESLATKGKPQAGCICNHFSNRIDTLLDLTLEKR
jgi:hypothetical protein